jgi:hypothetical protein
MFPKSNVKMRDWSRMETIGWRLTRRNRIRCLFGHHDNVHWTSDGRECGDCRRGV